VTKHYLGVYTNGPEGNGPSFASLNGAARKLAGILQDTRRGSNIEFVPPGTKIGKNTRVGSIDEHMTPGDTIAPPTWATIYLTTGPYGALPGDLLSNGQADKQTLGEILSHELGEVDAAWYHGGSGTRGVSEDDAVWTENETRRLNGRPLRLGHDEPPEN